MSVLYTNDSFSSRKKDISKALTPAGDGIINVKDDFPWTLSNNRAEVPFLQMKEYQQNTGQLLAGLNYYFRQVASGSIGGDQQGEDENPYKFLYLATPTKFEYVFPYLSSDKNNRSTTFANENMFEDFAKLGQTRYGFSGWGHTGGKMGGLEVAMEWLGLAASLAKLGGAVAAATTPGKVDILKAQQWQGTQEQDYTVAFDLINTGQSTNEIRKNRELAYLLTYQNSPYKRNFAITDPVVYYEARVPDVFHFPACYISNLDIKNLGNTRLLSLDGKKCVIPEAYRFSITLKSMLDPSRNIFNGVENENESIEAISTENLSELFDKIDNAAKGITNNFGPEINQGILDFLGTSANTSTRPDPGP